MLTDEEKRKRKNDKERARWQAARNAKLLAMGIDPETRPIAVDGSRGKAINPCKRDLPPEIKYPRPGESEEEFDKRYRSGIKRRYYERNQERLKEEKRVKYHANHEHELELKRKWREANPEKTVAQQKRYFEKNKNSRIATLMEWRKNNPERIQQVKENWYNNNQALRNSYSAKWRRECRRATPDWANFEKITEIYDESTQRTKQSGISHHVDHIVPVQGKHVTGLHIHQNMRIIPATDNVKKRARLDETLVIALMKLDWELIA